MKQQIDCQVFQDQLDLFKTGALPDEGFVQLRLHAETCPDCAMLLELSDHLVGSAKPEQLEAAVPDEYVTSMWSRVQSEIAGRESRRGWQPSRWLVPTLAAASVLLLISTGLLVGQLSQVRASERALARQLAQHERRLAELEVSSSGPSVGLLDLGGRRAWERQLSTRESVSVAELRTMLERVPANTTLLTSTNLDRFGELPAWIALGWRQALDEIRDEDGVQAGEALRALDRLGLAPDTQIPVERLLSVGRSGPRVGRL